MRHAPPRPETPQPGRSALRHAGRADSGRRGRIRTVHLHQRPGAGAGRGRAAGQGGVAGDSRLAVRAGGHRLPRSDRAAPAVRGAGHAGHRRGLRDDHGPGGHPLDPPGPGADRPSLPRAHRARTAGPDLHRDLHGHARAVGARGDTGAGRRAGGRAGQRRDQGRGDQQAGAGAADGAARGGRGGAAARRGRHVRDQRAAAPAHARDERGRAEPDARLPSGGAARGAGGSADAGRAVPCRVDQRRRTGAAGRGR